MRGSIVWMTSLLLSSFSGISGDTYLTLDPGYCCAEGDVCRLTCTYFTNATDLNQTTFTWTWLEGENSYTVYKKRPIGDAEIGTDYAARVSLIDGAGDASLQISPARRNDSREYRCGVSVTSTNGGDKSDETNLTVKAKPSCACASPVCADGSINMTCTAYNVVSKDDVWWSDGNAGHVNATKIEKTGNSVSLSIELKDGKDKVYTLNVNHPCEGQPPIQCNATAPDCVEITTSPTDDQFDMTSLQTLAPSPDGSTDTMGRSSDDQFGMTSRQTLAPSPDGSTNTMGRSSDDQFGMTSRQTLPPSPDGATNTMGGNSMTTSSTATVNSGPVSGRITTAAPPSNDWEKYVIIAVVSVLVTVFVMMFVFIMLIFTSCGRRFINTLMNKKLSTPKSTPKEDLHDEPRNNRSSQRNTSRNFAVDHGSAHFHHGVAQSGFSSAVFDPGFQKYDVPRYIRHSMPHGDRYGYYN